MMIYKLVIKRANGTVYWAEQFNSQAELNKWLAEEKTRPYWDAAWSVEISALDLEITKTPEQQIQEARRKEYPALTDFADAFVKMHLGDKAEMDAYVAKCVAVKTKYPLPEKK